MIIRCRDTAADPKDPGGLWITQGIDPGTLLMSKVEHTEMFPLQGGPSLGQQPSRAFLQVKFKLKFLDL